MSFTFTAQTRDGATSLSLVTDPLTVREDSIDFGSIVLTDVGKTKDAAEERITDADRLPRPIKWLQQVKDSDMDALRAKMQTLIYIMSQPWWVLVYNSGGATEQNKYWYCKRASIPLEVNNMLRVLKRRKPLITVEDRPLALGSAIELPRNYVVDPTMCEDYSGDGIPNSFVNNDSAPVFAHSHFCNAIDGAYIYASSAAAVAGQFAGISQISTSLLAAQTWSFRAEYKCTNAASCRYFVSVRFLNAGGTIISETFLVNGATLATDWAEVKAENILAPAGTTQGQLIAYIWADNTSVTGTIIVRDAMIVKAPFLNVGVDVAATMIDIDTNRFIAPAHSFVEASPVELTTTGTLPAPLVGGTTYCIRDPLSNNFLLSATPGGTSINLTTQGTGTHTIHPPGGVSQLPVGKNNETIFYGSEFAQTPASFRLTNIPGDAEALAIMQLGETTGGAGTGTDKFYLGITNKGLDNRRLVFKFSDLADSDPHCLSGRHSTAINVSLGVTLPATLKGKYWVIARCRTYSTTYAADQYHAEVLCGDGVVFSTSKIVPFATQKWTEISFGTVDFSFYDPDWGDIGYILTMNRDSGDSSWYCDYMELMPVDAIARAEISAVAVKQAMMSDTISDKEDLYRRAAESNIPVQWPMAFTEVYPFAGNRYSNTLNLPAGDSNVVIHCSPRPADITSELSGRSGALLAIKFIPRWSE